LIGAAILLGGAALLAMDRLLPHEHFIKGREGADAAAAAHLAVCDCHHPSQPARRSGHRRGLCRQRGLRASSLTLGIAIQDVPEGFVVAASLLAAGYTRGFAVVLGALTGLIEPLGAVIGAIVVSSSTVLLPWGLGFAAGAMLFVISHEIIPESHRKGHEAWATTGLMLGFVLMMILDTSLAAELRRAGAVQGMLAYARSKTAMDSTCAVCGNIFTTPAATQR
jgi:ZIP family zinc transporter